MSTNLTDTKSFVTRLTKPSGSYPSWLVFQLLERCNLRCRMCYEWGDNGAYHGRTVAELDTEVVLRGLSECRPARPHVELFGGEPLLYHGIWQVLDAAREGGSTVAFPTNGTLLVGTAERLVAAAPHRIWVSLDGPPEANDAQRGRGVFAKALAGIQAIDAAKRRAGSRLPMLGVTYVVTPETANGIEQLFLHEIDLSMLGCVSIELQSYATQAQHDSYSTLAQEHFGVTTTPCAAAYVQDPALFAGIDTVELARQIGRVRTSCLDAGLEFYSQPRSLDPTDLRKYLSADWLSMADRRERCAVPWAAAEVSARGDVTTCHTFYDIPLGNIHDQLLLDIWRGEPLQRLRGLLRNGLLPICTACCRYYTSSTPPMRDD